MPDPAIHLLDVNVVLALLDERHVHHAAAELWFESPGLQWSLCAFTEAGMLRFFTRPKTGRLSMEQASAMLERLKRRPGYSFQPISTDWQTLSAPFAKRIHGHNQVTDAYLLGLAVLHGLVLTTFDAALLHLAGEPNGTSVSWKHTEEPQVSPRLVKSSTTALPAPI